MELSPSKEAASYAAIQELPSNLWNPNVHHHVQKSPPLVPILRHINPVHVTQRFILILSSHQLSILCWQTVDLYLTL
jgi:hypothetical protein